MRQITENPVHPMARREPSTASAPKWPISAAINTNPASTATAGTILIQSVYAGEKHWGGDGITPQAFGAQQDRSKRKGGEPIRRPPAKRNGGLTGAASAKNPTGDFGRLTDHGTSECK